jgi:amino acid adenylation domain-containing protein
MEGFRLSPQQLRLWQLQNAHGDRGFGVQCHVELTGRLDFGPLERAIVAVVKRHEILRTKFAVLEGTSVPVQVVNAPATHCRTVKLPDSAQYDCSVFVEKCSHAEWKSVSGPSPKASSSFVLITLSEQRHILVITASALCTDAISMINLAQEIQREYCDGLTEEATSDVLQYADLAEWQNQLLEDQLAENETPYWKSVEFSALPVPRLPFEMNGPAARVASLDIVDRTLSSRALQSLETVARNPVVSLQSILVAAWATLLHRISGMDLFLLGIALNKRAQPELHGLVGPFEKSLPLRVRIAGNPRFSEFVAETNISLNLMQYDQLLFDCQSFATESAGSRDCLFPVLFAFRELPVAATAGSIIWEVKTIYEQLEPFEIKLIAEKATDSLRLWFAWDTGKYNEDDIGVLADAYIALLQELTQNLHQCLDDFPLSGQASAAVLRSPEQADKPFVAVHELIERHVRQSPDRVAVVCGDGQLTYLELSRRADILSVELRQVGILPDSVVAIVAERSLDFIVGILATLKAGAAWLPIEPDIPEERIRLMIRQARAVAVLTKHRLGIANYDQLPVIDLEQMQSRQNIPGLLRLAVDPAQLAYVIFTSGSTGEPKGVGIEHRQVLNYIDGLLREVELPEFPRSAVVSTMAADLGHTSVFASLVRGGCVDIIPVSYASDPDRWIEHLSCHPMDCIKIVPSHLEAMCCSIPSSAVFSWKALVLGGEALNWSLVKAVEKIAPGCIIFNEYGPTETTVGVICSIADPEDEPYNTVSAPIGRPRAAVAAYILGAALQPVSPWIPGELFIGGETVGRGYLGRPDLTAERFIPDLFSASPGARMYRSGDFARQRSDGAIEFLGRRDGQIKLRGYRVELGEIENILRRYPGVQQAVVAVLEDETRRKRLTAWAAVGSSAITPEDLQAYAAKTLPRYMVPEIIMCLDHLKLTPNGKLDRQSLPAAGSRQKTTAVQPALDQVEDDLVAVWQKVLNLSRVGVDDNYFSLGGDSLRVIQLVHEARRYGIFMSAADVLCYPTIRKLRAALATQSRKELFPHGLPVPRPVPAEVLQQLPADVIDSYPVTGMQRYVAEKYALNEGSKGVYHIQDCFQLSAPGFSLSALELAFYAVVERHPALRTVLQMQGPYPMQWVRRKPDFKIRVEDISSLGAAARETRIADAMRADRARLFDLSNHDEPLFRVTALLGSDVEFTLLFSCHHAIMDGWGHRVLINELVQSYTTIKAGMKPDLGAPDVACREFSAYQEGIRESERARNFWREYLAGVKPMEFVSVGLKGEERDDPTVSLHLSTELTESLVHIAKSRSISMQSLLLSSWLETLRQWSGEDAVVSGVITNGRSEYLTDPLSAVGLFWNIVPVISRTRQPLLDLAAEVQRSLIEMQPHAAYPLSQLLADQICPQPLVATFKYLNFWNAKPLPPESGLRLMNAAGYDLYSFPLNCAARIDPGVGDGYLQITYDAGAVRPEQAQSVLDVYGDLLKRMSSNWN